MRQANIIKYRGLAKQQGFLLWSIKELRPQHEFFDAIGLEKQLRDNERVIVLLTPKEAGKILFSERLQLRIYLILINIGKGTDNGQKKNNGMCFFYTHNVSYVVIYFF